MNKGCFHFLAQNPICFPLFKEETTVNSIRKDIHKTIWRMKATPLFVVVIKRMKVYYSFLKINDCESYQLNFLIWIPAQYSGFAMSWYWWLMAKLLIVFCVWQACWWCLDEFTQLVLFLKIMGNVQVMQFSGWATSEKEQSQVVNKRFEIWGRLYSTLGGILTINNVYEMHVYDAQWHTQDFVLIWNQTLR